MPYTQEQYRAAMFAARTYLIDVGDEPGSKITHIAAVNLRNDCLNIEGTIDLGELITAALDAADATA